MACFPYPLLERAPEDTSNELAAQMQTDVSSIIHMESYPGNFKFADIQLFSDALKVSIKELENLLK